MATSEINAKRAIADLQAKVFDPTFRADFTPLINPWPIDYDIVVAGQMVIDQLLSRIPNS